jgi:hypothetical protein
MRNDMNKQSLFKTVLLGCAVLLATIAFAANKGSLHVTDPVTVAGKTLPAGDYTLTWEGTGPSVELSVLKGKAVVAKTPARLVEINKSSVANTMVTKGTDDGSRSLSEIYFSGKKYGLSIGGDETAQAAGTK